MLCITHQMRTTLSLDDDVLAAARVLARERQQPIGVVISDLARRALTTSADAVDATDLDQRNGLPLLHRRTGANRVDLDLVNSLRDEVR